MTAQQRHDAIRKIARDKSIPDDEALRQIARLTPPSKHITVKKKNPKPAAEITDRAKRYRAQKNSPAGPNRCNFCGSEESIDVDHINGNETDGDRANLIRLCRSCNTRKGITQTRHKIGVRTRQFNPGRPSFAGFQKAALILTGIISGDVARATAFIRATPEKLRLEYGRKIAAQRTNPTPTFQQYVHGVTSHTRGAHDEGGRIIHATPAAVRSRYAVRIAEIKRSRGSDVPF